MAKEKIHDELIDAIEEATGIKLIKGNDPNLIIQRVPLDIPIFDNLIGGGFPKGRMILIAGEYSSCKTFLCQILIKKVLSDGGKVVYVDAEKTYDPEWFAKTGIDINQLYIASPDTGEETIDVVVKLLEEGVDLIVIDSLAAMIPSFEQEESAEKNTMALQARLINKAVRKFKTANKKNSILVMINQLRDSIGGYGMGEFIPGGRGQEFYSSIVLKLRRGSKIEDKDAGKSKIVGYMVRCMQQKNKVGGLPFQSVEIPFSFDGYIDTIAGLVTLAEEYKIIVRGGPYYSLFGEKYRGMNGLKLALQNNPVLMEKLKEMVSNGNFIESSSEDIPEISTTGVSSS